MLFFRRLKGWWVQIQTRFVYEYLQKKLEHEDSAAALRGSWPGPLWLRPCLNAAFGLRVLGQPKVPTSLVAIFICVWCQLP